MLKDTIPYRLAVTGSFLILTLSMLAMLIPSSTSKEYLQNDKVSIYCDEHNDLYQWFTTAAYQVNHYEDAELALRETPDHGILLILAKDYPHQKTILPKNFYQIANEKKLKVYVEFPDYLPSGMTGEITTTTKERLVITSDFFGDLLGQASILDAGLFRYLPVSDKIGHLKEGKVAGFDKAVYGLDTSDSHPVLFEEENILIATTKLSDFRKSRYAPVSDWQNAINAILAYLGIDSKISWEPIVKPSFPPKAHLTKDALIASVARGAEWYDKGRFLIHPEWQEIWLKFDTLNPPVGPPMDLSLPSGDGSLGVMEGHYSYINPDGRQPYRYWLRADCVAETAMTLAIANRVMDNDNHFQTAMNLMSFLFNSPTFKTSSSSDPKKSSYGLIGWADTHPSRYYGDDNARVALGAILAAQLLKETRWDRQIAELILANFRTSGMKGFRRNALMGEDIDETTWQVLMQGDFENVAPHYESWLWATYLWLYDKTGYESLLQKAKAAIRITMNNYPHGWQWANGLQQERARMILPLAWLVRIEETAEHIEWLNQICDDLLTYQVDCGALREELGIGSNGKYGAPKSNQHYGTTEAPVIHFNGEPVADMLYTSNFAFFSLNEAAQATQNPKYIKAVDKMADFLIRIQSTSSERPDLDGCWFRAFDYENWEYYGSNADHGWGAWGTLTGWTQSFITTTLALKSEETSYWDQTKGSGIDSQVEEAWQQMLAGMEH